MGSIPPKPTPPPISSYLITLPIKPFLHNSGRHHRLRYSPHLLEEQVSDLPSSLATPLPTPQTLFPRVHLISLPISSQHNCLCWAWPPTSVKFHCSGVVFTSLQAGELPTYQVDCPHTLDSYVHPETHFLPNNPSHGLPFHTTPADSIGPNTVHPSQK